MAGGIERMASAIMNEMISRGHHVSVLTWDEQGAQSFYELDDKIQWYSLDLGSHINKAGWLLRLKRAAKMRAQFKDIKPDVVLAFQHGTFLATRLYTVGMGVPIIAAEREAPSRFDHLKAGKWQSLIYQSMRLAKKITIQCESYKNDYPAYLRNKLITIPNPVFPAKSFAKPEGETGKKKQLLCLGRLSYQKHQAALIEAFSRIQDKCEDWDLLIAGEGEDRESLESLIKEKDLNDRISMPGAIKDTQTLYTQSHLSCLPARWEGFPNVVAESLAHGLPVVGYQGCAGVKDLIEDGVNGLLAKGNGDPETLASALLALMHDDNKRSEMGLAAKKSIEPYQPQKMFDLWEDLFKNVAKSTS